MSDAQHTQEKEALEDASNRLLVVDGVVLGTLAYTMVGTWTTKDGGIVTGPGYTVAFSPSAACEAAIADWNSGQIPPVVPPPVDPPVTPPPVTDPPPVDGTTGNTGAVQPGDPAWTPPEDA